MLTPVTDVTCTCRLCVLIMLTSCSVYAVVAHLVMMGFNNRLNWDIITG